MNLVLRPALDQIHPLIGYVELDIDVFKQALSPHRKRDKNLFGEHRLPDFTDLSVEYDVLPLELRKRLFSLEFRLVIPDPKPGKKLLPPLDFGLQVVHRRLLNGRNFWLGGIGHTDADNDNQNGQQPDCGQTAKTTKKTAMRLLFTHLTSPFLVFPLQSSHWTNYFALMFAIW